MRAVYFTVKVMDLAQITVEKVKPTSTTPKQYSAKSLTGVFT